MTLSDASGKNYNDNGNGCDESDDGYDVSGDVYRNDDYGESHYGDSDEDYMARASSLAHNDGNMATLPKIIMAVTVTL